MSTEERDESQQRPRKVIPSIRRENTGMEGDNRRPYNQQGSYGRPEGNYERRPYNQSRDTRGGGGYDNNRSYGDNNRSYGDYQSRPRQQYDNRGDGGYGNRSYNNQGGNRNYGGGGYGNNNRPSYGNNYDRQEYGHQGGGYRNRPSYPSTQGDDTGEKKRRPRVGDARVNQFDNGGRPSYGGPRQGGGYGDNRQGGGGYGNRPSYGNNRGGGYGDNRQGGGGYGNRRPMDNRYRTNDYNPNAKYSFQKQLKYKEVLADPNEPIRLNKFLANAGVCSRREADEFIQAGVVKVNDQVITELGTKITRQDNVLFHDKQVQIESKLYILLNKPKNCVTTSDDPQERLTVLDLVKGACQERIYPVGRLDRNTTGVLLLTNDGDLASKLTHPSYKKKKIYHVWLDRNVAVEDMQKIADGIELEDGEIHADAISYASDMDKSQVGIEIHSGRNRIVRRIFESLGYHVIKLDRVYFAGLTKKGLSRGKWRYLNEREVNALRTGAFE